MIDAPCGFAAIYGYWRLIPSKNAESGASLGKRGPNSCKWRKMGENPVRLPRFRLP